VFLLGLVTGIMDFLEDWWDNPGYSWPYVWYFTLITVAVWGFLVAALAFGMRAPAFQRPLPRPLARAAMPFFIVHQPIILVIVYYVVEWNASILAKSVVLMPAAFITSAALAWLLSATPGVSALFGVKARSGSPSRVR
jgi:glucan biosynthesis protein C